MEKSTGSEDRRWVIRAKSLMGVAGAGLVVQSATDSRNECLPDRGVGRFSPHSVDCLLTPRPLIPERPVPPLSCWKW